MRQGLSLTLPVLSVNQAGGADAANLLKPALARGELRTIAATTWSEYKQYFERDAALERRFQMVKVDEPDNDTACLMLRGLKARYVRIMNPLNGTAVRSFFPVPLYWSDITCSPERKRKAD